MATYITIRCANKTKRDKGLNNLLCKITVWVYILHHHIVTQQKDCVFSKHPWTWYTRDGRVKSLKGVKKKEDVLWICVVETCQVNCDHDDRRLGWGLNMWTVLENSAFSVFWLNLIKTSMTDQAEILWVKFSCYSYSSPQGGRAEPHASSSRPRPSLWPPALMFFPSTRADRVSFIPGANEYTHFF